MADDIKTPATTPKRKTAPRKKAPSKAAVKLDPVAVEPTAEASTAKAKSRFNAAIEEAKAGVEALTEEARERAIDYRAKAEVNARDYASQAREYAGQAKETAAGYARDGKAKASDALGVLGKSIGDTASTIDEKLGVKYGDYARTASRTVQEAAVALDNKSIEEMGEDAREFVRKSPGTALGIAAVTGFFLARLFRRGSKD